MYKQAISFFNVENEFFTYVLVIIGIYIAQTFFKISAVRKEGTFSFKELFDGMIDYAIYFLGIMVFFFSGMLIPKAQIIPLSDKYLTIDDALTAMAYALIIIQSVKCFKNIKETFNVSDEQIVVNDKEASFRG